MFFRFPTPEASPNPVGNSAANMQRFIDVLDELSTADALGIASYLRGGTGFKYFRELVKTILVDRHLPSVIWADDPSKTVCIKKSEIPTEQMCRLVREQMIKMLRVGAFEWMGFELSMRSFDEADGSPDRPATKRSKNSSSSTSILQVSPALSQHLVACSSRWLRSSPRLSRSSIRLSRSSTRSSPSPSPTTQTKHISHSTQTEETSLPLQPDAPAPTTRSMDTQTETEPEVIKYTASTQTTSTLEPPAGTYTVGDKMKEDCMAAQTRLFKCIPKGFHLTSLMILVVLKFTYYCIVRMNWSWTQACYKTAEIFGIKTANVFKLARTHRDSGSDGLPAELTLKKRGRGSDTFKQNDVDERFTKLKKRVLVDILDFVRERNRNMKGMCTVRAVQAHIFQKHNLMFKYKTVWYAMSERLGLKYKTALKKTHCIHTETTGTGRRVCH